jgi:formylglycine-generating enzyme
VISRWIALALLGPLTLGCNPPPVEVDLAVPADRVRVPGGGFVMGSDEGASSNRPAHLVLVADFYIERTEVTQAAFLRYVEATGGTPVAWRRENLASGPDLPAAGILWREADAYFQWHGLRRPTEAENRTRSSGPHRTISLPLRSEAPIV